MRIGFPQSLNIVHDLSYCMVILIVNSFYNAKILTFDDYTEFVVLLA